MRSAGYFVLLGATAVSLAGCGSTMRDYLEKSTPTESVAVRQDLTMPPDLRLPPPGTTQPAPDPGAAALANQQAALTAPPAAAPLTATAAAKPATGAAPSVVASNDANNIYTNAGISIYNPDGTKKSDQQLRDELQAYYIAQKKAKNPKYGTVFNIGNIFKDE